MFIKNISPIYSDGLIFPDKRLDKVQKEVNDIQSPHLFFINKKELTTEEEVLLNNIITATPFASAIKPIKTDIVLPYIFFLDNKNVQTIIFFGITPKDVMLSIPMNNNVSYSISGVNVIFTSALSDFLQGNNIEKKLLWKAMQNLYNIEP